MSTAFSFEIVAKDGAARRGEIDTPRGKIRTPAFMPVGTAATVKAMFLDHVREAGADIILGNTYHLMLRPGAERIAKLGGLHKFMGWKGPILTDSGGFQVMSLSKLRKIDEHGVTFASHLDGTRFELSPERAIEIQSLLGSDIVMQLDECIRLPAPESEVERAMQLSLRWAARCKRAFEGASPGRALFGIAQGGTVPKLRKESARELVKIGFHGYAIGGLAVGEPQDAMLAMIEQTMPELPADKPRYLMGVGEPDDILAAVERGIDMFDCVLPTRAGRHALAYTRFGKINLKNARHAEDTAPLDAQSQCPAARDYSRAYLHHLVKANEMLGAMLLTWNNIAYYQALMQGIREAISAGRCKDFAAETRDGWKREER
ncbi:MAG TPA: tRNA guanosine(34) transglycosylase Tgt [Xanthobacteraceae bacterium]|nr:tRNA guanosine(34) transglycosylase Tgt [Xanthobacteraceae bacterium]